jgi:hypothetical protein
LSRRQNAARLVRTLAHLQPSQLLGKGFETITDRLEPPLAEPLGALYGRLAASTQLRPPRDNPALVELAALGDALADPLEQQTISDDFAQGWRRAVGQNHRVAEPWSPRADWKTQGSALFRYVLHYGGDVAAAARQAWLTQDARLADLARRRMIDWTEHVPIGLPAGWRPFPIAMRAAQWGRALHWLDRAGQLPAEDALILGRSLAAQGWYLRSHLEFALGANHLLRDYVGMLLLGAQLDGPAADHLYRAGAAGLERELSRQWLGDGGHEERCPGYHALTLIDLAEARAAAKGALRERLTELLQRGGDFLARLIHPDGTLPRFGDTSLDAGPAPRRLLSALGHGALQAAPAVEVFKDSGFAVISAANQHLVIDLGPLGPDHQCGHAHADIGAFEWSVQGERLIVDPGVPGYDGDLQRPFARSALAHNVAVADDRDHAEFWGAFRLGWRPKVQRTVQHIGDELSIQLAWTDDFRKPHLKMQRTLLAKPGLLQVRDRAEGATGQQVRLTLHPEARIEQDASGWILQRGSGFLRLEAEAAQISLEPAQVWETMGAGRPAPCAVLRGGDQLNWTLRSV